MIIFKNISKELPYKIFKERYIEALSAGQRNIEAIVISSFNKNKREVDSRFVNLKQICGNKFIFFSNYNSPKSKAFESHNQISATIYWSKINTQIRIKAKIKKTSKESNQKYFKNRSLDKNALAISSDQSKSIISYEKVVANYDAIRKNNNLLICPDYWGGFEFTPYEIEFWKGNNFRLNKRDFYYIKKGIWHHCILEP